MPNPKNGKVQSTLTRTALGPLEARTLELVWELNECSVRDIVRKLPQKRAYTTIMTTLARLHEKGILNRKRTDRKFVYWARLSCAELEHDIARDLIARVLTSETTSRESIVSALLEELRRQDSRLFNKE
jgi:predicted transcriptional regulator